MNDTMSDEVAIFWFRRDLRLDDNAGLYHALKSGVPVLPIFIFDTTILSQLDDKRDGRVTFIHQQVSALKDELNRLGSDLLMLHGTPFGIWEKLLQQYRVVKVFTNHDYEPLAIERDHQIENILTQHHIPFFSYKDQCIFEKNEIVKEDGSPYTVFTPYAKKWKATLNDFYTRSYPSGNYVQHFLKVNIASEAIGLDTLGFEQSPLVFPSKNSKQGIIRAYQQQRDFPAAEGTSRLSLHFRFGTISIREKVRNVLPLSETYLNELIWRDFYMMVLFHFPHVATRSFRPEYDTIRWLNNENDFAKWCTGNTGYPIVDAGMRELNQTGFMHNRVRMIVASFLTKHLLIDWRWGEAYFAQKLLDFDMSANNGGWQWAAGCGTDAAPYFRIFNPTLQTQKFDPNFEYIRKWVPEWNTPNYPLPMVQHELARKRCLDVYKKTLTKQ